MADGRRINWLNVITVVSAAILIGAEVFGAAFAGSLGARHLVRPRRLGARVLDVAVRPLRRRHDGAVHPRRASHRAVHRRAADARVVEHVDKQQS